MKRYTDNKSGLTINYPDDWTFEKEDNIITTYNVVNGSGALQFSTFYVTNDNIDLKIELEGFLSDKKFSSVELNGNIAYSCFNDGSIAWQYWLLKKGNVIILATYNCEIEDKGKEDVQVNQILNSIIISSNN